MLESKRTRLRLIESNDLEMMLDTRNHVALYMDDFYPINFTTPAHFLKEYESCSLWDSHSGTLAITDLEDRLLGEIEFFSTSPCINGFEIGFVIYDPSDRKKGYMKEALPLFCSYLFESRNINRITAHCISKNQPACQLLERCGFTLEGTVRGAAFHRGTFLDYKLYGLLKSEAPSLKELTEKSPE